MLKIIPSVALSAAPSYTPLPSTPFTDSVQFQWNVEGYAVASMIFAYEIGEGPLYWFRIDWAESLPPCPPSQICVSMTPMVTYTESPNCPSEISVTCMVGSPTCACDDPAMISCTPGQCVPTNIEIWHMLATSVDHLCYRINNECCQSKPKGFIKRIQQYMRPALCCDVDNITDIVDDYVDVDFIDECQCGNLIHPCLASITYDCNINNCGINGPVASATQTNTMMMMSAIPDFMAVNSFAENFQIVPPKQIELKKVSNKFGKPIPELIYCNHNLNEFKFLKDVLKNNRMAMLYDKGRDLWRGTENFKDWKILIEWSVGYNFNLIIDRNVAGKNLKTKLTLNVKDGDKIIDFDPKSGTLKSKGVLKSKVVQDGIGLLNELKIKLEY